MDDLERIPVGVEYIGGIVSRIVFQSCAGRNVVPGTSGHFGLVEFIDLVFIFGHETPMNGCWIRLPLLYPEERLLAVTKSPQIGMAVFALVRHEESDLKRLQGRLIEGQRTFDIAHSQNKVVEHRSPPSNHECFNLRRNAGGRGRQRGAGSDSSPSIAGLGPGRSWRQSPESHHLPGNLAASLTYPAEPGALQPFGEPGRDMSLSKIAESVLFLVALAPACTDLGNVIG